MSLSGFRYSTEQPNSDVEEWFSSDPFYFYATLSTSHWQSEKHTHNYMQLWYVLHGSFRHMFHDREFIQGAGDFVFVPSFCSHIIDTSQSHDVQFIYCDLSDGFLNIIPESHKKDTLFNLAYLRPLLVNANQMRPFISFHGESKQQIESLFFELITESQQENRLSETYIRSNLLRLLTLIVQKYEKFSLDSDYELFSNYRIAIQNALNYIDEHYTQNITLAEISRIAMMSVRSFSSVFKQITGKTFLEYIHYLRVRDACEKLRNSNASLTSVCYACGFSDLTYFGRIFKKVTGETPSSYRKIYRNPSQMR